jgi:hypothetical protein
MKVKELLTDESKWTKGAAARNARGVAIFVNQEEACQFCLSGALQKCYGESGPELNDAENRLAEAVWEYTNEPVHLRDKAIIDIIEFNDWRADGFKDIRAVIEKADV